MSVIGSLCPGEAHGRTCSKTKRCPVRVPPGCGGRGCGGGRDGDCGSGTAALGNISLHLSNETKTRENTHEKKGKEKLLGNKIKVLPSKMLSCSYEETQIALIAAATHSARRGTGASAGLALEDGLRGTPRSQHPAGRDGNTRAMLGLLFFILEYSCPHSHGPTELGSDVQMRRNTVLVLVQRVDEGEEGLHRPPLNQLLLTVPVRATAGDTGQNKP